MNPYYRNHPVIDHLLETGLLEGNLMQSHLDNMNGVGMGRNFVEKLYDATANKVAYYIAGHVPTEAGKNAAKWLADITKDIAVTGWHNAQDPMMQGTHMRIGLAQALLETAWDDFDGFLWLLKNDKMPDTLFNKFITRARELGESGNNTYTADMLRRHILSGSGWKLAFSYLQGYHMQRLWELTTGLKKLADAHAAGEVDFLNFGSLKAHLWQQNPELRKVIGITFDTIHTGFMLDHYYDDEETQDSLDYGKLFHGYINTFQANVMGRIISTALWAHRGKDLYEDATGKELTLYQGVSLEVMDFIDAIPGMMYREFDVYKFIPKLMNSYFTGDAVMNAALRKEMLEVAFSGNYRYSMPTGENTFGAVALPEQDDVIGSLLLGMHTTNATVALADKMYAVTNADKIIRGADWNEQEDSWFEKTIKTLPFIEYFTQNSRSKSAEWAVLKSLMTTDPIMKSLYARDNDVFTKYIDQFVWVPEKYTEEVNDFWEDLTAFNYAQWNKKDLGTTRKDDFYGSDMFDHAAKEELFTTLLENKLGKDFVANINTEIEQYIFDETWRNETAVGAGILKGKMPGPTGDQMGIQKILVTSEALQPWSAKVIVAYIANKKWYNYAKANAPKNAKWYPDTTAFKNTDESTQVKKAILDEMFPNVYLADKTAYLKVIRNQAKNKYPEVFEKTTDSSKALINTMSLNAFMAHQEILSGQPSAGNINSMIATSSKYIKNDADRLMVLNYGLRWVYGLPGTLDEKDMVASGMLFSNVDMLHRLAKDEEFKKEYPGQVEYAVTKLFWIADKTVLEWHGNVHAMIESDMTDADKQSYRNTYGSSYSQRPYNATNKSIQDKLVEKANSQWSGWARSIYNPSGWYTRPMSIGQASNMSAVPRPKVLDSYFKIARDEGVLSITSPALLKQTVKRNLESENGGYRQPQASAYKKRLAGQRPSVWPLRKGNIKKRWPNVQLPLWLINIW